MNLDDKIRLKKMVAEAKHPRQDLTQIEKKMDLILEHLEKIQTTPTPSTGTHQTPQLPPSSSNINPRPTNTGTMDFIPEITTPANMKSTVNNQTDDIDIDIMFEKMKNTLG